MIGNLVFKQMAQIFGDFCIVTSYHMQQHRRAGISATYTTGKTFGKTTLASAKYSYKIRWSKSSVVYLTWVAWEEENKQKS